MQLFFFWKLKKKSKQFWNNVFSSQFGNGSWASQVTAECTLWCTCLGASYFFPQYWSHTTTGELAWIRREKLEGGTNAAVSWGIMVNLNPLCPWWDKASCEFLPLQTPGPLEPAMSILPKALFEQTFQYQGPCSSWVCYSPTMLFLCDSTTLFQYSLLMRRTEEY